MKTAIITTVKKGKHKGEFKFTLKAANGEAVAQSYPESYTALHNCIKTLKHCFPDYKIVDKSIG
jgi:uncharacterized protein YegP (UPF0339 family)